MAARAPDTATPLHLSEGDFDAYLPERAASSAFAGARLQIKERLVAWGRRVAERLDEIGVSVDITASDDQPSARNGRRVDAQRVFFWRDASSRETLARTVGHAPSVGSRLGVAPHKEHAYLAIRLDAARVEVSIEVHAEAWVDVRNLRARLGDIDRAIELAGALEALPEQFSLGVADEAASRMAAQGATTGDVRALLDRVELERRALWVGWSVPRDVAIAHSNLLDEQLEDAIVALGPLYKVIAWAPDNDLAAVDRAWDAARAERARAVDEAEESRGDREARHEGVRRARGKERDEAPAWRPGKPDRPRDAEADGDRGATPPPPQAQRLPVARPRRFARRTLRTTDVDPSLPIDKGTRVVVLAGPFAGKRGIVHDLDGRGGARVMLGLLAIRTEVSDLVASTGARERPLLSSSHRKRSRAR